MDLCVTVTSLMIINVSIECEKASLIERIKTGQMIKVEQKHIKKTINPFFTCSVIVIVTTIQTLQQIQIEMAEIPKYSCK